MPSEGDSAQHALAILKMLINSDFQTGAGICRSGRWASSLRQRFFSLYRNELRFIPITCASLGTEAIEAPLQRLVDLLNFSEHLVSPD